MLSKKLLNILACPKCKRSVFYEKNKLVCKKCRLRFSIVEGIPNMLLKETEKF